MPSKPKRIAVALTPAARRANKRFVLAFLALDWGDETIIPGSGVGGTVFARFRGGATAAERSELCAAILAELRAEGWPLETRTFDHGPECEPRFVTQYRLVFPKRMRRQA